MKIFVEQISKKSEILYFKMNLTLCCRQEHQNIGENLYID